MGNKKAAVFVILGQSNATGHAVPMAQEDIISTPLKNVFGLHREQNQSFDIKELCWSGYTSGGMNLGEEQDHTYSIPNCLAAYWQKHIDAGNQWNLPDLYIIQMAIGGQGITRKYMWYPEREQKLIPGKLGTVNISMFPLIKHIFSLLDDSFRKRNVDYEIMGLHWRGGEDDTGEDEQYMAENQEKLYQQAFDVFDELLHTPPIVLHKIICGDRMNDLDPSGKRLRNMNFINEVFYKLEADRGNVKVFDPACTPQYIPGVRGNGIFREDVIHFTPEVNQWIAKHILEEYAGI